MAQTATSHTANESTNGPVVGMVDDRFNAGVSIWIQLLVSAILWSLIAYAAMKAI